VELYQPVGGVINEDSIDVVFDPSLDGRAVIRGDKELIESVELYQNSSGVLSVRFKPRHSSAGKRTLVRIPAISGGGRIDNNGSGDILIADGTLTGYVYFINNYGSGRIRLAVDAGDVSVCNGSGSVDITVTADKLQADLYGWADIRLSGKVGTLEARLFESGGLDAFELETGDADVDISGSGDATITVNGALTGSISGSGSIICSGTPASVKVDVSGSGGIRQQ
jgi:hypothetical protein